MTKQQVIDKIEKRWADFRNSFEGLSDEEMTKPAPDGGWSIKDQIVHVRTWEEETLKHLPTIEKEQKVPRYKDLYGGIDQFNKMTHDANQTLSLRAALGNLEDTHKRLLNYLESVPAEQFASGTRFLRRLSADTYNHYPEHTKTILELSQKQ